MHGGSWNVNKQTQYFSEVKSIASSRFRRVRHSPPKEYVEFEAQQEEQDDYVVELNTEEDKGKFDSAEYEEDFELADKKPDITVHHCMLCKRPYVEQEKMVHEEQRRTFTVEPELLFCSSKCEELYKSQRLSLEVVTQPRLAKQPVQKANEGTRLLLVSQLENFNEEKEDDNSLPRRNSLNNVREPLEFVKAPKREKDVKRFIAQSLPTFSFSQ